MLAREPGGVEVVAEGRPHAGYLVGGDLLALPAAAEHDPAVCLSAGDGAADAEADGRVVHGCFAGRPVIVHDVSKLDECLLEMLFQDEAGMIGANRNSHGP